MKILERMKYVYMINRDIEIIKHIKMHYYEMKDELSLVHENYDEFLENETIRKAITFDLLQIGELFNNLSDKKKSTMNKKEIRGIIDIRNYIVHGYVVIDNKIIWDTIHNNLDSLMNELDK